MEKYLTGYIVEKSLSVDNIFVISMIFTFFAIPAQLQHRVLFWGVLGAIVMRGVMIAVGSALIVHFHWVLYVFGVFLIVTAIKMLMVDDAHQDPNQSLIVKWIRRWIPVSETLHSERFLLRAGSSESPASVATDRIYQTARAGTWLITPLMLALIMVEFTDLIFAVDSIPAIFAITSDPFLVFTSNIFAILGLRSLYFALADMVQKFRYLKVSLAAILILVGTKMLVAEWLKLVLGQHFNVVMLAAVLGILLLGIVASLRAERNQGA